MQKLLEFILKTIVSHPKKVKINLSQDETTGVNLYQISVDPEDLGQVIGRQGKIIKALRRLAYVLASQKQEKVNLLYWQVTCEMFCTPEEWQWWFNLCNYKGDHSFIYFL